MALSLVTAPTLEPVSLAEAKLHLRLDVADDDALTDDQLRGAREYAETFTHRAFITQTWDLTYDYAFPAGAWIELPCAPLVSVTSVTYVDTAGTTQTWSASLYTVDAPSGPKARPGRLVPIYGEIFPATRWVVNAVTVRFVAGYAATAAAAVPLVPKLIKACIKEHCRAATLRGDADAAQKILNWVDRQLWAYKAF